MHIISLRALRDFWEVWPDSKIPLQVWHRIVRLGKFGDFKAFKAAFNSVDYAKGFTIFDIGGNKFRIIAAVHYNRQKLYIRYVFTHQQYDDWSKAMRKAKPKTKLKPKQKPKRKK
ncbi:MAG: type II toxin-antitoxin system HigB family toxin [Steroidobacteraceae bacterium]